MCPVRLVTYVSGRSTLAEKAGSPKTLRVGKPIAALALFIDVNASSFDRGVVEVLVWQMGGISLPPSDAATKSVTDFPKPVPASLRLRRALALPLPTLSTPCRHPQLNGDVVQSLVQCP